IRRCRSAPRRRRIPPSRLPPPGPWPPGRRARPRGSSRRRLSCRLSRRRGHVVDAFEWLPLRSRSAIGMPADYPCQSRRLRWNHWVMEDLRILTPPPIPTELFDDATAAVSRLEEIYERNTAFLRARFEAYANGEDPEGR